MMPSHSDEQRRIMAADRQRLAQALAAEAARRKMFESIPEAAGQGLPQAPERPMGWNDYLENLSIGLGRGAVSNLEGIKGMVTSPVETLKGVATGVTEAVRNPRMVAEALKQTGQRAMSGPLGLGEVIGENVNMMRVPGKPVMHELDVYHGTPHRFPATEANPLGEFDASKIGTGEGAQAYGHGIYYAESPDVAESYRVGTTFAQKPDRDIAEMLYSQKSGNADAAIASLKSEIRQLEKQGMPKGYKEQYDFALQKLQEFKKNPPKGGALYKADLPDEMIDRMLDWDKPLSEQSPFVQQALEKAWKIDEPYVTKSGERLWNELSRPALVGTPTESGKSAAEFLRQAGIPGIKYLDAGSRGQGGTGTRNFVVFPGEEKKVRILERK